MICEYYDAPGCDLTGGDCVLTDDGVIRRKEDCEAWQQAQVARMENASFLPKKMPK